LFSLIKMKMKKILKKQKILE